MSPTPDPVAFDQQIRRYVYDQAMRAGRPPPIAETAAAFTVSEGDVRDSFQRLAESHILVLQPEDGEILMANPFSAVPTPFVVRSGERSYYGNCIWDALGIPAMLGRDAVVEASCADCGTAMTLEVAAGRLRPAQGVAHFAVPAMHWWDDVVFT